MTSMSSVDLWPPSSAPHKMLVHWSSSLGVSSFTSLSFSSLKGSVSMSAKPRTSLALSSNWWGMWSSTVLSITRGSLMRFSSRMASASLNQAAASFS